jgi:ABC-type glycerol-3-phosphate transport system substrate-binding protein
MAKKRKLALVVIFRIIAAVLAAAGVLSLSGCKMADDPQEGSAAVATPFDVIETTPGIDAPTQEPVTGSIVLGVPERYQKSDTDALARFTEAFNEKYPGIAVTLRTVKDAAAALNAQKGSDDYADVVFFPGTEAFEYAYVDRTLMCLDEIVAGTGAKEKLYTGVFESSTVGGKQYAIGTNCDPLVLIYDKSATDRLLPGRAIGGEWNFDEFSAICLEIGQADETLAGAQLDLTYEPLFLTLFRVYDSCEVKAWADAEKCKVELSKYNSSRELEKLIEVHSYGPAILPAYGVFEGTGNPPDSGSPKEVSDALETRTPVFRAALMSELGNIAAEYEEKGIAWDVAPFPRSTVKNTLSCTATGTDCFDIRKDTDMVEAASLFVSFAVSPEGQSVLNSSRGTLPSLSSLPVEDYLKNLRAVNTSGKNFAACVPARSETVPSSLSCYMPSSIVERARGKMKTMTEKAIKGTSTLFDSLDQNDLSQRWTVWNSSR